MILCIVSSIALTKASNLLADFATHEKTSYF